MFLFTGKLWCAKKNKRKRKKPLYNTHKNDGKSILTVSLLNPKFKIEYVTVPCLKMTKPILDPCHVFLEQIMTCLFCPHHWSRF